MSEQWKAEVDAGQHAWSGLIIDNKVCLMHEIPLKIVVGERQYKGSIILKPEISVNIEGIDSGQAHLIAQEIRKEVAKIAAAGIPETTIIGPFSSQEEKKQ